MTLSWLSPTVFVLGACLLCAFTSCRADDAAAQPPVVRDVLWAWGNPEMAEPGEHDASSYAQASCAQRAAILGVPNVVMAGLGLPNDDALAASLSAEVSHCARVAWEISPDAEGGGPPFTYEHRMAQVRELSAKYPQFSSVLLDDMSTVARQKGFLPEHIRQIRALLGDRHPSVAIKGVVYTMSLAEEGLDDYIRELDGISLWVWHARDIPTLEEHVAELQRRFPEKPIELGVYLYDYGDNRRMPLDLLRQHCEAALKLVRQDKAKGIIFLTITNDAETVGWARDWVARVGPQPLTGEATAADPPLSLGDGRGWHFLPRPWSGDGGVIRPPNEANLHSRSLCTTSTFSDFTAEFEVNTDYRETGSGMAGLIFRATDADHGYLLYFPWGGQQLRAKHFWAALGKLDGDGYIHNVAFEWVPGVPSETDRWYSVHLEATGPRITVSVDGRKAVDVVDDTYSTGCLGFAGYGWYAFRNARLTGRAGRPPQWDREQTIPTHAFTIGLTSQDMPSGCVAPNGDVLIAAGRLLARSTDKGRTWGTPAVLPEKLGSITDYGSSMLRTNAGRLLVMLYRTQEVVKGKVPEIAISESLDSGVTWSDPVPSQVAPGWPAAPASLTPYGPPVETADGTLLRFLLGGVKEDGDQFTDVRTWSATHCKAFCIRSSDGGASWSAPIELDRPSWVNAQRGTIPGSLDLTEPTGVALGDRVMVLVRPVYSPMMWQCWSEDAGASWDAAARATFPGYAQSMLRTASGAILCAHRYPQYCVNVSRDDGVNWDAGTIIDYPIWAMGCAIEVEPDVVLFTYMNAQRDQPLLAQRVAVTTEGLRPADTP